MLLLLLCNLLLLLVLLLFLMLLLLILDLLILLIGTAIAGDFDLEDAFWNKMDRLGNRESRIIEGRIRVSEFRET